MNISEVMTRSVRSCQPQDGMNEAARIMWESDCGCAPVVDQNNRVIGMITDRDLCMAAYTSGRPLQGMQVHEAMSQAVACVHEQDDVEVALQRMALKQVHRLPVVDQEDHLTGLVSASDLLQLAQRPRGADKVPVASDLVRALAKVTQPRGLAAEEVGTRAQKSAQKPLALTA